MIRAEITIVGGGVMGLALGRELARSGRDVVILEKAVPGAEASSAAAGILGAQAEAERPGVFLDLCLKSREMYAGLSEELKAETGVDIGYRRSGVLKVGFGDEDGVWLTAVERVQREAGLPMQAISGDEVRRLEPELSPLINRGVYFPDDAVVDNRLLVQALALSAQRAGARVVTGQPILRVQSVNGRVQGVELDNDYVISEQVCVCAGSWMSKVRGLPLPADAVVPARGQMVAVMGRPELLTRVVFVRQGYLVPRADGRIIAGSTVELAGFSKEVTVEGLGKLASQIGHTVPSLSKAPVIECWAGLRPCTRDFLPALGETSVSGLFVSTGHFRNGILLAPMSARLLRQAMNREPLDIDLDPFRPGRLADETV